MRHNWETSFLMLVIGLFSCTQLYMIGSIAVSELVMFVVAPVLILRYWPMFRMDRCATFIKLCLLSMIGCILSSKANGTSLWNFIRGFATPYGWLASFVVFYVLLRKCPHSLAWYLLGVCISNVLCTFVLQSSYEQVESMNRGGNAEAIMTGAIYWISRIGPFVTWPIRAFYLKVPYLYSVMAPTAFAFYAVFSSASGRSSALTLLAGAVIILIGGKNENRMKLIRRNFVSFLAAAISFAAICKIAYSHAASTGVLGEVARAKYESQTKGGTDVLHLIMGGRGEFFMGLYYCLNKPIIGYGPWAIDDKHLFLDYLSKYGNSEDYDNMMYSIAMSPGRYHLVGAHSSVLQFWLMCGILGLPIWLYFLWAMYSYLKKYIGEVPALYGYFAITLPGMCWAAIFSPFGMRLPWGIFAAVLFLNRAMAMDKSTYWNVRRYA